LPDAVEIIALGIFGIVVILVFLDRG